MYYKEYSCVCDGIHMYHLTCSWVLKPSNGPGSVVGVATTYGLDSPEIESRWGEIFRTSPERP